MDAKRGTAHRARADYSPVGGCLAVQEGAEKGQQLVAEVGPLEREADVRFEIAGYLAGVVVVALDLDRDHLAAADRAPDGVGKLDLASGPRLGGVERPENVVGE